MGRELLNKEKRNKKSNGIIIKILCVKFIIIEKRPDNLH
jgi:hypothetical protein